MNRQSIDEDIVACCLLELMSHEKEYVNSVTGLLCDLSRIAYQNGIVSSTLPKTPNHLSKRLSKIRSNLQSEYNITYHIARNGYISIILTPVQDDTSDILEELNLDHTLVRIPDNNFLQIDIKNKKHPMNENRRWVSYDLEFLDRQGKVYAIYSMKTVGE